MERWVVMTVGWVDFKCPHCGMDAKARSSAFNRAARRGAPIYCGRVCAGLGRRKNRSADELRAAKAAYDAARRIELADRLRAEKAEYHRQTYDPAKAAIVRKARMPKHVEYCRQPEYRAKKVEYDREYRSREYGEFAECYLLTLAIRREALSQMTDYEIRQAAGTLNKSLQRKREYERTHSNKSEIGALGHVEPTQGGQHATGGG